MNKQLIALLGACFLFFANMDAKSDENTNPQQKEALQSFIRDMLRVVEKVKEEASTSSEENPNWLEDFKREWEEIDTPDSEFASFFVDYFADLLKKDKGLLQEAKIKKEGARKYIHIKIKEFVEKM